MMGKRLYKTSERAMLAGVCAGLAEYLCIDVTLVRLGFILVSLMGGAGVLGYIVAAIIMPDKGQVRDERGSGSFGPSSTFRQPAPTDQPPSAAADASGKPEQADRFEQPVYQQPRPQAEPQQHSREGQRLLALGLIGVGSYLLLNRYWRFSYYLRHLVRDWWPLIPLALGVVLLLNSLSRRQEM